MSADNDSDELEALFDSLTAAAPPLAAAAVSTAAPVAESLSAAAVVAAAVAAGTEGSFPSQDAVFDRLGKMARQLHNTLHELGYDKMLEKTMTSLPDARDRLAYVANLTEQAACRVLNATDVAQPAMTALETEAKTLRERWDRVFANQMTTAEFKKLAEDTRAYLSAGLPGHAEIVNAQLLEIMMAQDFQDLTGQVIKKIVELAQKLENNLVSALLEVVPQNKRSEEVTTLLNGPVINAEGRTDVVVNQQQVDDLLGSLGF
ncbi:MAG: protein phosphatase CheZ [Zoogloeaceae bacterium]|jgi:chemotaxis protein CheZ|nr:protein phosphatase CheZ [Zoogloeaceae bacterium]